MSPSKKIFSKTGEPLLPARKVALRLKCSPDYVGKLCREGKLEGERIDGAWFVSPTSIERFEIVRTQARTTRAFELARRTYYADYYRTCGSVGAA